MLPLNSAKNDEIEFYFASVLIVHQIFILLLILAVNKVQFFPPFLFYIIWFYCYFVFLLCCWDNTMKLITDSCEFYFIMIPNISAHQDLVVSWKDVISRISMGMLIHIRVDGIFDV